MIDKKEAASMLAHGKRQGETNSGNGYCFHTDSTIEAAGPQVAISEYLHVGAENALSMKELKARTGLPAREVRRFIQLERLGGVPVVVRPQGGYYLAESERDVTRFLRSMRHRAREILRVAAAMEGKNEPEQKSEIPTEGL